MRRCWSGLLGSPKVLPRLSCVEVARGGAVKRSNPGFQVVTVAGISLTSKALAISPTDWIHSGQAGTNKAAFT